MKRNVPHDQPAAFDERSEASTARLLARIPVVVSHAEPYGEEMCDEMDEMREEMRDEISWAGVQFRTDDSHPMLNEQFQATVADHPAVQQSGPLTSRAAPLAPAPLMDTAQGDGAAHCRRWRVDGQSDAFQRTKMEQRESPAAFRRTLATPPLTERSFADYLVAAHASLAPHASVIVTLALLFSASLLYWLTIKSAPPSRKEVQAYHPLDEWRSQASQKFSYPDEQLAVAECQQGVRTEIASSDLNGDPLAASTPTMARPLASEQALEGALLAPDRPRSSERSALDSPPGMSRPPASTNDAAPQSVESRRSDAAAPLPRRSAPVASTEVAQPTRTSYPATPFPKIDYAAVGLATEPTNRK